MTERTAVYRLYDMTDVLLYVGISKDFGRRWKQHASMQPWWGAVDHQTVYWYPSRNDALLVEKTAITSERPVHNRQHAPKDGWVEDERTGFSVPADERGEGTLHLLRGVPANGKLMTLRQILDPASRLGRPPADGSGRTLSSALEYRYEPDPVSVPDAAERYGNVCDLVIQLLWPDSYGTGPGDPLMHTSDEARMIARLIFQAAGIDG